MNDWTWIALNGVVGLPLAALTVVVLREGIRAAVAPVLEFRVFALRFGAGQAWFDRPVGPIDLALGIWPVAGATVARSAVPRHHRRGRALLAIVPGLGQIAWLVGRAALGVVPGAAPLFEGPAPLACLDFANTLLLVVHATLAVEFPGGVRTDVRLLLDTIMGAQDGERSARADYYARLATHALERAQVEEAAHALERGLTQLGRPPLLVACERRLAGVELDSVIDQGDAARALRLEIEAAEPRRRLERTNWSLSEGVRQRFASALPLMIAFAAIATVQADRWVRHLEGGMLAMSGRAIAAGDAADCGRLLSAWEDWAAQVDPWLPPDDGARSDRHRGLADLERCRGAHARADAHRGKALLAAQEATRSADVARFADPSRWLNDELRVTSLLRETAEQASRRAHHRDALRTLHQAEQRLVEAERRLPLLGSNTDSAARLAEVSRERTALTAARAQILTRMRNPS